jgi:hypothetical protein
MPLGSISRYESTINRCQIKPRADAHTRKNHIFQHGSLPMGIRDHNPTGDCLPPIVSIAARPLIQMKPSRKIHGSIFATSRNAIIDVSKCSGGKGVEQSYPYRSPAGLYLRQRTHDTPENVSGMERTNSPIGIFNHQSKNRRD